MLSLTANEDGRATWEKRARDMRKTGARLEENASATLPRRERDFVKTGARHGQDALASSLAVNGGFANGQ